jgi:hypothetical protein
VLIAQEQTMDATDHVKRDLVHFFRTYKAHTLSMHVGPLETHLRGYKALWKDALQGAIDALVAEGVMERQGGKLALTEQGKQAVLTSK